MKRFHKPLGERLGWKRLSTTFPLVTRWLRLRRDRVRIEGKREITFTYVESPGAVGVVPVTGDGRLVLIRQYRYTVDEWGLEVPAGGMHDAGDASLEEVAREELRQELGANCERLEYIGYFYTAIGNSSQAFHVYLALDVALDDGQSTEDTELIELQPRPVREVVQLVHEGGIKDGASALAILLCEDRLREYGYL